MTASRWVFVFVLAASLATCADVSAQQPAAGATDAATRQYATAVALQNREQFDLAAAEWNKFIASYNADPRVPRAMHYRGLCLLQTKQYGSAAEAFEKLVAMTPKLPADALVAETGDGAKVDLLPATYMYLGRALYNVAKAGDAEALARADRAFATLLQKYPDSKFAPQALYYRGEVAYASGRKAEAVAFYDKFASTYPKDPLLADDLYALGIAQSELNQPAKAEAAFATFLKAFPQHRLATEVSMRRGESLLEQDKLDEAEKVLGAAAATPNFALADHATMRQAAALFEQKKYAAAGAVYQTVPQKFPQSPYRTAAALAAGRCLYMEGKTADARAAVAKITPADGDAYFEAAHWTARSLLNEKKPGDALKAIDPVLKKAGNSPWGVQLQFDRADALHESRDSRKEAAALYKQIAADNPKNELAPQALYMAAFTALELEDYREARKRSDEFLDKFASNPLAPEVKYVAAESALLGGDYGSADKRYRELLKDYPQHRDVAAWQLRRAEALLLDKKYKDVVEVLGPVADKMADSELAADAYYRIGVAEQALKHPDRAATALAASLARSPKGALAEAASLSLAEAYADQGKTKEAQDRLTALVRDFPKSQSLDKAYYRLGQYAGKANDLKASVAAYKHVVDDTPKSPLVPHALYDLAWIEVRQDDAAAAIATFDKLLATKPKDDLAAQARFGRAIANQALKKYDAAIDDLQAFLKSKPSDDDRAMARYRLGLCYVAIDKSDRAVETFEKLLKEEPKFDAADQALNQLAWAYKGQKKEKEAAETFEKLATTFPASPLATEALYHLGEYQYQHDEFKKAAASFHSVASKITTGAVGEGATHMLGWCFYRQDQYEQAWQTFDYQRQQYPQGELAGDAACMQGESLFKQKKYREALLAYDKVRSPKAKGLLVLARLHAGQAAAQLKDWTKSFALLKDAEQVEGAADYLPDILYEQAWAKQNLGKLDEALALYQTVTEKTGDEVAARARFMMGEIHFEQKNFERAITDFIAVTDVYGYPEWQAAALYETARIFEVRGQKEQARKSYQELIEKHPKSDKAPLAKERLAALGG